jgi:hypothetical protein
LAALVIFGIEPFYRQPLLDVSKTAMRYIQKNETEFGKYFFIGMSTIGLGVPYFISILYYLIMDSLRGRSFYHLLFITVSFWVMNVTKMAYAEPRMFWWVQDIVPDECTAEFGNPSGHSELAIAYPMLWYLDLFENKERDRVM